MIKILFVCHGNICRSAMAECILTYKVQQLGIAGKFKIDSCATSTEEIGCSIYPPAREKLEQKGIPVLKHRARQITQKDYDYFDYIIAMDNNNLRNIARRIEDTEHKVTKLLDRDVADPWYTGNFERTYNDLCEGIDILLKRLQKEGKL